MDTLVEMDRCFEKFNLRRPNQEGIEIMNKLITKADIETVIKNLPKSKNPGSDGFTGEFYQTFRDEVAYYSETLEKDCRRNNTSKLIL